MTKNKKKIITTTKLNLTKKYKIYYITKIMPEVVELNETEFLQRRS